MNREERLRLWVAGYRMLMAGHLSHIVHTANTPRSEMSDGQFAYITIDDIEALLDGRP